MHGKSIVYGKSLSVAMPQQSTARIFDDAGERSQLLQQQNSRVRICLGALGRCYCKFSDRNSLQFSGEFPIYWKGGSIAHAERCPEVTIFY